MVAASVLMSVFQREAATPRAVFLSPYAHPMLFLCLISPSPIFNQFGQPKVAHQPFPKGPFLPVICTGGCMCPLTYTGNYDSMHATGVVMVALLTCRRSCQGC